MLRYCESCSHTTKHGKRGKTSEGFKRYVCTKCGKWSQDKIKEDNGTPEESVIRTGDALFIGDTHFPFDVRGYLEHCARIRDKYKIEHVYHVGDLVDHHATSYHDHDPDGLSAGDEANEAMVRLSVLYKLFDTVYVCYGNHDALPNRKAMSHGLSRIFVKDFLDAYGAPSTYEYQPYYIHDNIRIFHGLGGGGQYIMAQAVAKHMINCVVGHAHTVCGIYYRATERKLLWGMSVGCGIDRHAYSMAYAKDIPNKPIISCGATIEGIPHLFPMNL